MSAAVSLEASYRTTSRRLADSLSVDVNASLVSQLLKARDPILEAFRTRPLGTFPYLLVDARFERVRAGGRVGSRAFLWATGINANGEREVLGWLEGPSEGGEAWQALFKDLIARGLNGVELVVSDAYAGLSKVHGATFPGAGWQECQAHFLQRSVEQVAVADQKSFRADVRMVLDAPDREQARQQIGLLSGTWREKAPKAVAYLEDHLDSLLAVLDFPVAHQRRLKTTNLLERIVDDLKRKGRQVRTSPDQGLRERIFGALLMKHHEAWAQISWLNMRTPRHRDQYPDDSRPWRDGDNRQSSAT